MPAPRELEVTPSNSESDAGDEPVIQPEQSDFQRASRRVFDPMNVFDAKPFQDSQLVKDLLDANPGSELIICVAGCKGAGQPSIMLKRPSRMSSLEVAGLLSPTSHRPARDGSSSNTPADDEVICLAGCIGPNGTIVFRGRQHAWIRQDVRDTLAEAMHELAARLLASTIEPSSALGRQWVSQGAREKLKEVSLRGADENRAPKVTSIAYAE